MRTITGRPAAHRPAGRTKKLPRKPPAPIGEGGCPLDAAGQERVEEFTWLAYRLAWTFARHYARDMPIDELISEALFSLTYASGLFDESRGVPFSAYASLVIRHGLIQEIIRWRRLRRIGRMPTFPESESKTEAEDRPTSDLERGVAAREMCRRVREVLPAHMYDALWLFHGKGHSLKEIGKRMGVSRQRIRQMMAQAQRRLREFFPEWSRY
jgi:RNA polymerase sigma factor (sigma-70 family)